MGILSDSTPAIFEVDGKEIKGRVLTLKELIIEIKAGLRAAGDKIEGLELDTKAEECLNDFNFPPQCVEGILYQCCKITNGFTRGDAAELTKATLRKKAYEIFTYAIYGVPPDSVASESGNGKKKKAKPIAKKKTKAKG